MKTSILFCNIIVGLLIFTGAAGAQSGDFSGFFGQVSYNCEVIGFIRGGDSILEKKFSVGQKGNVHGGEDFLFEEGPQKVVGMADGTWLGVEWYIDGALVAKGLFVQSTTVTESRVLMLFNPANDEDQLSLACNKAEK